ncbi:hypothetical protein D1Y85_25080 [Paraburkholderia dinghuensis]|uniref:DUF4148 domain-containing protein n=2 Tax=Paraburkholderia dinghuensis TaxID=2305225 RepID=A0A3N6PIC0_9BURK|nr:hypothetical protein D1Y85_25080 [Paraburkholderia dinghuensis]
MVSNHIFRKPLTVWLTAAAMTGVLALTHAAAYADGPPLILDTQHGIIDGQKGMVLQNAPLSHEPMVAAHQPAEPAGLPNDYSQPYIVSPYIAVPGAGTPPNRPRPPHHRPRVTPHITPQVLPAQ